MYNIHMYILAARSNVCVYLCIYIYIYVYVYVYVYMYILAASSNYY